MSSRLEADIGDAGTVCSYAENCPLLVFSSRFEAQAVEERYITVCSNDRRYGCPQYVLEAKR